VAEILVSTSVGIVDQSSITDTRSPLPFATSLTDTGSSEYDAIVGQVGIDQGANFGTLKAALDNAQDGWKILVLRSETLSAIPAVLNDNIEVVFKRGVTLTKGSVSRGLRVDGEDCKIVGGRFSGFNVGGDAGIEVSATAKRTVIEAPRFDDCDSTVIDNGLDTYSSILFVE